jgi:hypothetical protein
MRSVFIEYDPYNRLGNRMFQYAFGYIVSKEFNCPLYSVEGLPNLGIKPNVPEQNFDHDKIFTRDIGDQYFDLNLLKDFTGDLIVNSWLQKSSYYINYRKELQQVFGIKDLNSINDDALVLHIRGTDYNQLGWFLGYKFYKALIENNKFTKIKIVTDDPECDTVNKLVQDGCELVTRGPEAGFNINCDKRAIDDFKTLLYSKNIAISQSSFSWWAAFLGNHNKVIFPYAKETNKGMWLQDPGKDDVDLFFDFNGTCVKYIL